MLPKRRPRASLPVVALLLIPTALMAQPEQYGGGIRTRSLIVSSIDENRLISLVGNTHPAANAGNDLGAVADTLPLNHLWLQLQRPPELEKELVDLIDEMNRPASPQFHNWLTAAEFGRRYGASRQDAEKVTGWLRSHGFTVNSIFPSGMIVEFSGNAAQVRAAFHTEIHNLDVNGELHIANMSDPQIPAALSGVVKGVVSLHNFMPKPKLKPKFNVSLSGSAFQAVAPPDMATIYNLNPLFTAGITGKNQTIVVIEDTNILNASDVSTFRSAFGLSTYSGTFSQTHPTGSATCTSPGVSAAEDEAALDAEWAGAAAPDAAIVLASCADTDSGTIFGGLIALQNLINGTSPPKIVSISYGECESQNGAAPNATYVSTYQQAAALGISVFVSAGDEGAASCDAGGTEATHGIAVSGFASTPYNVAVGGTDFMDTYNSATGGLPVSTYWSGTNGTSYASALSYIPEIPWNDSCAGALLYSVQGFTAGYGSAGFCNSTAGQADQAVAAGSGGPSNYSSQPSWQTSVIGLPTASGGPRYIPDVSLFAANGLWNHFYVYCMSDTREGGATCDYTNSTDVGTLAAGGTSFSSPIMAGIMALINQKTASSQGNPNPRLYQMAGAEYGATGSSICNSSLGTAMDKSCVFYDVTKGDIDVNCTGTTNCYGYTSGSSAIDGVLSTSSSTLGPAYPAGTGWDYATGLGTINAANLVNGWVAAASTTAVTSGTSTSAIGAFGHVHCHRHNQQRN
jgi:subtilase family serine protease